MKPADDLKMFVIEELTRIARECPDYRLRIQALTLLAQIIEGMET